MPVDKVREIMRVAQGTCFSLKTPIGEEEEPFRETLFRMMTHRHRQMLLPIPYKRTTGRSTGYTDTERRKVLRLRFGLEDGRSRTLEEVR